MNSGNMVAYLVEFDYLRKMETSSKNMHHRPLVSQLIGKESKLSLKEKQLSESK